MNALSLKARLRETNSFKSIYFIIVIGVVIVGNFLIISNVIGIGSFLITIFLFCLLPLVFIEGFEKLFLLLILSVFIPFEFTFGGVEGWQIKDFLTPILLFLLVGSCAVDRQLLTRVPRFSIPLFFEP